MENKKNIKSACGCECDCSTGFIISKADAVMAICILAMTSDGKIKDKELRLIDRLISMNKLFNSVKNAREYAACVAEAVYRDGRAATIKKAAGMLSKNLKETAYAWAVYMIISDGKIISSEHKFLNEMKKALNIHGVLAKKIKGVVSILHRFK